MTETGDNWAFLVDASVYIFRAWHSYPDDIRDTRGQQANAVHGFAQFLCQLLERTRASHVGVAFDESLETSFRNRIYPAYKANREPPPPELARQMKACRALVRHLGLRAYASDEYEADDLIGTMASVLRRHDFRIAIVSRDKDLSQLLGERDVLWDFADDRRYRHRDVKARFGAEPSQMADLLALAGDAVDNVPGVPGIGRKTAAALLERLTGLDEIYARLDEIEFFSIRGARRVRNLLREHREQAYLSRKLTRIVCDLPLPCQPRHVERKPASDEALRAFCRQQGFSRGLEQRCLRQAAFVAAGCGET